MSPRNVVRTVLAAAIGAITLVLLLPTAAFAEREMEVDAGMTPDGVRIDAGMVYKTYGSPGAGRPGSVRLIIQRDGETALDFFPEPRCDYCGLYNGFPEGVRVQQLDTSPEPEIMFTIYSGGAHCCNYSLIFRYADGGYKPTLHEWGNDQYDFRNIAGKPRLLTRDDRFAYRFDAYALSRYPVRIWSFEDGQMLDVTREYPSLIRKDAKKHKRRWRKTARNGRAAAPLAAWVADQCLLGRCSSARRQARVSTRNGAVDLFYPHGRRSFQRKLDRTLIRFGYTR